MPRFSRSIKNKRSTKMRCSAAVAAAELEQRRSRERKKMTERGRMKKDLKVVLIYKERLIERAQETRRPDMDIQLLRRLDFRDGH